MTPVSRRSVLIAPLGAAAVFLVGCQASPDEPAPVDPDRVALEAALEREEALRELTATWRDDTGLVTSAEATAIVTAHVDALTQTMASSPPAVNPASPTPEDASATSSRQLAAAASDAALAHRRALMTTGGLTSRLLASLSASDVALARAVRIQA